MIFLSQLIPGAQSSIGIIILDDGTEATQIGASFVVDKGMPTSTVQFLSGSVDITGTTVLEVFLPDENIMLGQAKVSINYIQADGATVSICLNFLVEELAAP